MDGLDIIILLVISSLILLLIYNYYNQSYIKCPHCGSRKTKCLEQEFMNSIHYSTDSKDLKFICNNYHKEFTKYRHYSEYKDYTDDGYYDPERFDVVYGYDKSINAVRKRFINKNEH